MKRFFLGAIVTMAAILTVLFVVAATGAVDVAATNPPGTFEHHLLGWARDRAIATRAGMPPVPVLHTARTLAIGLDHYRENCVLCHGAPGIEAGELAKGLNPPAPDLTRRRTQAWSDGALFWIVKHGIRASGMPGFGPTHDNQELAALVAFVRHLPALSAEEKAALQPAIEEGKHHHHHDEK